jgi:tetratricopeptide (TPR) repeat protein
LALAELAMLLMRQGRMEEAKKVAERAVVHMPGWSLMQRIRIVLTQDVAKSEEAVRSCPWDGEVWLAYLVLKVRGGAPAPWVEQEIRRVIDGNIYSPGTLVRAGDFLARRRMWTAAAMSARKAIKDGEGLLAAYVLGIRCALGVNDTEWAVSCAKSAAEQALEPWKFFKVIAGLKSVKGKKSVDASSALEELTAKYPEEGEWKERLGEMYFENGELAKAQQVLEDAIARESGKKQASIRTFLLAAEAARREGKLSQAIRLLRLGRSRYPNDLNMLNNLVYALAQDPQTAKEAAALVPFLLGKNKEDFALYDTAALACLRAGDMEGAERHMKKALNLVRQGGYAWLEVYLNAAETQIKLGRYKEAKAHLDRVRNVPSRSPEVERRARDLLAELERRKQDEESL